MKKVFTVFAALAMVFVLASCGGSDNPKLKASKAKSIVNKELKRVHGDVNTATLTTGYYECNDDAARYKLRQLAANEVITYSCDRVQKVEKGRHARRVQRNYWGYTYYDTEYYYGNDTTTTYFVTVALTDKGRKMVIDSIPEPEPTADMKDMNLDRGNALKEYPEDNVPLVEFPDEQGAAQAEEAIEMSEPEATYAEEQPEPGAEKSAYDMAKEKESTETVLVKASRLKVVKVRNIAVNYAGVPVAHAEVVVETTSVTPFGRIMAGADEGERDLEKIDFRYLQDKGWVLAED